MGRIANSYNGKQRHALVMALIAYGNGWSAIQWATMFETDCAMCGEPAIYSPSERDATNANRLEIGHIVSDANGGAPRLGNLAPMCGACNRMLGDEDATQYVSAKWLNRDALEQLRMTEGQAKIHKDYMQNKDSYSAEMTRKQTQWKVGGHA